MNYELCKQLKDAGFPQEIKKGTQLLSPPDRFGIGEEDKCYAPTLSELIEACGKHCYKYQFICLYGIQDEWYAERTGVQKTKPFKGKTPEEAVAKLWLELNKLDK